MSYLFSDFNPEDRVSLLEMEITRLQDLCAKNFATIDEMKKESKKLHEIHTELRETTTDLAYHLAPFPWWQRDSLESAVRILASFTQKIQYILELPTFIDPIEQLQRNCELENSSSSITKILKRRVNQESSILNSHPSVRICKTCKKQFQNLGNYEKHRKIHQKSSKRVKCRFCPETFHFIGYKIHLKNIHSFPSPLVHRNTNKNQTSPSLLKKSNVNGDDDDEEEQNNLNIVETLKKNNVCVYRYVKCERCDSVCSLNSSAYQKHMKICQALQQEQEQQQNLTSSCENPPMAHTVNMSKSLPIHKSSVIKNSTMTLSPPKLITLHEDTETEQDGIEEDGSVPNLPGLVRDNATERISGFQQQRQNTFNKSTTPIQEVTSISINNTTLVNNSGVKIHVINGGGNLRGHTTINSIESNKNNIDVACEPVRLASINSFSINTNSSSSPSSSTTINANATLTSSQTTTVFSKEINPTIEPQSLNLSKNKDDVIIQNSSSSTPTIPISRPGNSGESLLLSSINVPHQSSISSKLSPTMCFLPSSSSSSCEEEQQPRNPEQASSSTGHHNLLNNNHGPMKNKFTCSHRKCSKSFLTKSKLFHHEKTHSELTSRSFTCQLCSKVFKDKYRLKTHFFTHCSESYLQKPMYRCLECGLFHSSLNDLARHNEAEHSNQTSKLSQPRFHCDCGFFTNFRCKLDLHKRSSTQCCLRENERETSAGTSSRRNDKDHHRVGFIP